MLTSLGVGYMWLMPDEFKNFGQSLTATSLFSNNILLAFTSGYWSLASEFKPLLHTWSLGVEEQYYVIVPFLLMFFFKFSRKSILYLFWIIFFLSFSFSNWYVNVAPDWAFYTLPTRAWEICIGALASFYMNRNYLFFSKNRFSDWLSFAGFFLILFSIFCFDEKIKSPGYLLFIPTFGAVLIILFCRPGSLTFKILGNKITVFIGLISYSLYLWHQPFFAFLRAYSSDLPSSELFFALVPVIFIFSFLTWKFVECPFRDKVVINKKNVFIFSSLFSIFFISVGFY
jgi:peptidoglycan/LPS O-acetylase OafA/YrhL